MPTNGGASPNYKFKINNDTVQNGTGNSFTTSLLSNNDSVRCIMTGNNACTTPVTVSSNIIKMTVSPMPTWYLDYDADGYYKNGSSIAQCNSPGSGYTKSIIAGGDCNDSNAVIHPGAIEICGNSIDENCNSQVDEGCPVILTLKVFIEGFYLSNGTMSMSDTVQVELHNTISPFNLVESNTTAISQNGIGIFHFSPAVFNAGFYIVVRHRNTIETWTKDPLIFNNHNMNFDFSTH